jgi:hypothetical protein
MDIGHHKHWRVPRCSKTRYTQVNFSVLVVGMEIHPNCIPDEPFLMMPLTGFSYPGVGCAVDGCSMAVHLLTCWAIEGG